MRVLVELFDGPVLGAQVVLYTLLNVKIAHDHRYFSVDSLKSVPNGGTANSGQNRAAATGIILLRGHLSELNIFII